MEALISAALADGVLTEKEKQVLFKKAQSMGIDLDEFEMVLDARLVELEKAEKEKAAKAAPKSNKIGDVRKCPQCGAVIGSFQMICPECGFEFSGVGPNKFVEKFSAELRNILEKQDGGKGTFFDTFDTTGVYKEKRQNKAIVKAETNFVKNYPLPLTKEDCIEMLNFILPKTQLSGSNGATQAWRSKYNAILSKLENENRGNKKILDIVESYRQQAKISGFGKFIIWYKGLSGMVKMILWMVLVYAVGGIFMDSVFDENKGMDEVKAFIEAGDIDAAKMAVKTGANSAPLYEYYMQNKLWDDAEEFIPRSYGEVSNEVYFEYCKKAVTEMCHEGKLKEAKKFIKRKIVFYESNNGFEPDDVRYRDWNTTIVEKKLNAIVDNY